jgi:hypothetical protein
LSGCLGLPISCMKFLFPNNGACTEPIIKHVYRSTLLHCQLSPQLWDGNRLLVSKTEMNG